MTGRQMSLGWRRTSCWLRLINATQIYSIGSLTSALGAAQSAFDKYAGKKGALTVKEASDLLNR